MTIYFANEGAIDLNAIRIMGVNVKENDSPIGYFGTGLKFAIATLLRTGHKMTLTRLGEVYRFETRPTIFRSEEFLQVFMNDEALPFTTQLGRKWEDWQAYRELHSNTLDEGGETTNRPAKNDTVFTVTGEGIEKAFAERRHIFLEGDPIAATAEIEVHRGETRYVYYRGVRAGQLPERALFTYNINYECELSEDRVFKSLWDAEYHLAKELPKIDDDEIASALLSGSGRWDQSLNFSSIAHPSPAFLRAAVANVNNASSNSSAKAILEKHTQKRETFDCVTELSPAQKTTLDIALVLAQRMGAYIVSDDIKIALTLGPSCRGLYHTKTDQIYLSALCLDMGVDYTAATIFEEWVHKVHKANDYTREWQDIVLQRFVQLAKVTGAGDGS